MLYQQTSVGLGYGWLYFSRAFGNPARTPLGIRPVGNALSGPLAPDGRLARLEGRGGSPRVGYAGKFP